MASDDERLTILEMEYALVAARLNTIDAEIALVKAATDRLETKVDQIGTETARTDGTAVRLERMLTTVVRHLGLEPPTEPSR